MNEATEHSILYVADGQIFKIGPFPTYDEAIEAGEKAQAEGEFDIRDQYVYILSGHSMIALCNSDLGVE